MRYASLDIETDGLHPEFCNIYEVALILADGKYEILHEYQWFVKPQYSEYMKQKKFSDEDWKKILEGKKITEVIDEINSILDNDDLLVGYNIGFDLRFLNYWGEIDYGYIDVMALYHQYFDDRNKMTLDRLGRMFGIKARSHRALMDARKALWILKKFS